MAFLTHYGFPMHSPFTACLSQKKKNNSVVVDGGAVVEFFCLSISYGYCLGLGVNAFVFWWAMTEINSIIEMILNIV